MTKPEAPRTTCGECGIELWGSDESHGLCGPCALREDEETGAFEPPELPDDGDPESEDQ